MPVGSICPKCKVGHIYPTGKGGFTSDTSKWKYPELESEYTEYKCDKCGHIVREITIRDRLTLSDNISVEKKPQSSDEK